MLSFRFVSLISALACATLSFAVPVDPAVGAISARGADSLSIPALKRDNGPCVPDVIYKATGDVKTIIEQINIVIAVETVDTNRVTSLVANIGEVIKGAIQDLNQISASAPLTLEGADITLPALAQLVYTLLDTVIGLLNSVAKYVDYSVIGDIGGLLCNVLNIVTALVSGLLSEVIELVGPILGVIKALNLSVLVELLVVV